MNTCLSLHKVNDSHYVLVILTCKVIKTPLILFNWYTCTIILRLQRKKLVDIFQIEIWKKGDQKRKCKDTCFVSILLVIFVSSWKYINYPSIHNSLKPKDSFCVIGELIS